MAYESIDEHNVYTYKGAKAHQTRDGNGELTETVVLRKDGGAEDGEIIVPLGTSISDAVTLIQQGVDRLLCDGC